MGKNTQVARLKKCKPLPKDCLKGTDRKEYCGSRPIRNGNVIRTGKGRQFIPARAKLEDCKVIYDDKGARKVIQPTSKTMKKVEWRGKTYYVPANICG